MHQFIRKRNRIENFDYSTANIYLITICTLYHEHLFGTVVAGTDGPATVLSPLGQLVERAILEIEAHYSNAVLEAYSILPNHIHLLLRLDETDDPNPPSIPRIVKQFKGFVTKTCGKNVWQKNYHDRVIRTREQFENAWIYVTYNPAKWESDEYYVAQLRS